MIAGEDTKDMPGRESTRAQPACDEISQELRLTGFAMDRAAIAAFLIDRDAGFLYVNEQACRGLGYSREELLSMTVIDIDPEVTPAGWQEHWAELKRHGVLHFEAFHRRKDGRVFPVEVSVNYLEFSGREYNWAFARDISARRASENRLRQSEQRFRDIAEQAEEWIWEVDAQGKYTYASPVVEKILGYRPEEMLDMHFYDFFHPAMREELTRSAFEVFSRREPFRNFENLNVDRMGRTLILSTTGIPVYSEEDGLFSGYRGVDRDITLARQAEDELRLSESRFRNLFEQSSISIMILSPEGLVLEVNRAYEKLWGLEFADVGKYNILEDEQLAAGGITPYIRKGFDGEPTEIPAIRYDPGEIGLRGRTRWVKAFIYPVMGEGNHLRQVVLMHLDITEQVQAEEAVRESEKRLALAQQAGGVGVFDFDLLSGRAVWTAGMEKIFGLEPGDFEGAYENWLGRLHPEDRPGIENSLARWQAEGAEQVEFEFRCLRGDGRVRWVSAGARFSYLADGAPARLLGAAVDVTERKEMEELIRHQAYHDELTDLPNRRLFADLVNLEMARARRNQEKFALLYLDLSRFKEINDTLGHRTGDELLKGVAERLRHNVRESDSVARIGGDEFNILLSSIARIEDVAAIADKIVGSFRDPFLIDGHLLQVKVSVGISIYPDDALELESLFRRADTAMYQAKQLGGNRYRLHGRPEYSPA